MTQYSHLNEEAVIQKYLDLLNINTGYCVDIGASDGIGMSNTRYLFLNGWSGLALEYDDQKFIKLSNLYINSSAVKTAKHIITPDNIVNILSINNVPEDFEFLSLDIDGYDYFVLDSLLDKYKPQLICAEINEKIPPPIKFSVKYTNNYFWDVSHFYGMSISALEDLAKKHNYDIVELYYNNVFLIDKRINPAQSISAQQAYLDGYSNKPERDNLFPWNRDMEILQTISTDDAIEFINNFFSKYKGYYFIDK